MHDQNQNTTDVWKSMTHMYTLHNTRPEHPIDVAIFGGLEGRADQALSQLHQLYSLRAERPPQAGRVYLITSSSVIFLLERGFNRIHTPVGVDRFTENAGIVPLVRYILGYRSLVTKIYRESVQYETRDPCTSLYSVFCCFREAFRQ